MAFVTLATKDGAKRYGKTLRNRDFPVDHELAPYLSPVQEIEVYCTVDEAEEFERDATIELNADVVSPPAMFEKLLAFLAKDYGLKQI